MKSQTKTSSPEPSFAAFIGIDWADEKHAYSLCAAGSEQIESGTLDHTPESIQQWAAQLKERFQGQPIALSIELTRGPLVSALLENSFITIFPITPNSSEQFRKALHPSGAKSDAADSLVLLRVLRQHRDQLRPLRLDESQTRLLAQLNVDRRAAVQERTAAMQRLTAALKEYFPLALQILGPLKNDASCRFLLKWGSLPELQAAKLHLVRKFYYGQNCRAQIEERLERIKNAAALTHDPAVIEAGRRKARLQAGIILCLNQHIQEYDQRIQQLFKDHPDFPIFDALPGAGCALAPRLLATFGLDRSRFPSASDLAIYSGIAPIEKSSGKSCHHNMRLACPKFHRQTFHEYAGQSLVQSPWARKYYQTRIATGAGHHATLRSLAFKWIRIIWACWATNEPYDEAKYNAALIKRGSPYAIKPTA